jgi:hypothetical protein
MASSGLVENDTQDPDHLDDDELESLFESLLPLAQRSWLLRYARKSYFADRRIERVAATARLARARPACTARRTPRARAARRIRAHREPRIAERPIRRRHRPS